MAVKKAILNEYRSATTKVYNATKEDRLIQVLGKGYLIKAECFVEMDDHRVPILEKYFKGQGFVVCYADDDFDLEKEVKKALKDYISETGHLGLRIRNYKSYITPMKQQSQDYEEPIEYIKAKQWKREISEILGMKDGMEDIPSFLPIKKATKSQTQDSK